LAAHIEVLRKRGMPIHTQMCKDVTGRTYARYSLVSLSEYYKARLGKQIHDEMWSNFFAKQVETKEIAYHA